MIVSELIKLLGKQDADIVVGIHWTDGEEVVAYADDVLLITATKEHAMSLALGIGLRSSS